jgi:hypothetical protein
MITIFKTFAETTSPISWELDKMLNRIKNPKEETRRLVDSIRTEKDGKQKKLLKSKLACILFSGKFASRKDSDCKEHSGYAVVDFDNVPSVDSLKNKLKLIPYCKAAFTSPSGNGVKAVVRIPKSILFHRENYESMIDDLGSQLNTPPECFDKTSKNISRICYISYDLDIYIASTASCYNPPKKKQEVVGVDYNKINIAANMIRLANDGEKHATLYNASRLIGGYIASGMIEEVFAIQVLENEIQNKNIDDFESAKRTIRDGIAEGKKMPLYEREAMEKTASLEEAKVRLVHNVRRYEFLTDLREDRDSVMKYKTDGFRKGQETGHELFDEHFLFKEGDFNVVLGHANVGKSYFMWWLMILSAVRLDWCWIVYTTENKVHQVKKKLIEFRASKSIDNMSIPEVNAHMDWLDDKFSFIRIDRFYNATDVIDYARILLDKKEYKGFLIDPYNSLSIDKDLWKEVGSNRHEYDYAISAMFVNFCDENNISIYLNAHAISEALRRKHPKSRKDEIPHRYEGHPMPPENADIEGGGKFVNRVTGFFMVVHRYLYDSEDWNITKVEIKKVKDTETGGSNTKYESPINFRMTDGMTGYADDYEFPRQTNPIKRHFKESTKQIEIQQEDQKPVMFTTKHEIPSHPFGDEADDSEF